jgi:hypothetical protein
LFSVSLTPTIEAKPAYPLPSHGSRPEERWRQLGDPPASLFGSRRLSRCCERPLKGSVRRRGEAIPSPISERKLRHQNGWKRGFDNSSSLTLPPISVARNPSRLTASSSCSAAR